VAAGHEGGRPDEERAAPGSTERFEDALVPGAAGTGTAAGGERGPEQRWQRPAAPDRRPEPPAAAPAAPPPRHRWGLGAFVVVELVFLGASFLLGRLVLDGPPTAGALALAVSVPTVLAAGTALLITRLRGNGPRMDLRLQWTWHDFGLGLAFGFGGLALTIPASIVFVYLMPDTTSAVGQVFAGLTAGPALAVTVFLVVVLVAPMCEEIVYRGLLWGAVERLPGRFGGRWVAFGVTTVLFALAHFEFTRAPLLLVVAIPIAVARLYTGRLLASIVAHQVNNLLPGVVLLLGLLGVPLLP
jgi:uncharacterized protein